MTWVLHGIGCLMFLNPFIMTSEKALKDFYTLNRLDPGYQVVFGENEIIPIGDSLEKIYTIFEKEEAGSSQKLKKFITSAKDNYEIAIKDLVYRPGLSPLELITPTTIKKVNYFLSNINRDVNKDFKSPKLRQILQFPVLFLGAKPSNTPSFYNFMNFADFEIGNMASRKRNVQHRGSYGFISKIFKCNFSY